MFSEHVQSRSEQASATRRRVLESAESSFRELGFEETTIRQIAADAGVSVGTVMSVGDKDALLLAVFDGWIADVHITRAATGPPAPSGSTTNDVVRLFAPFVERFSSDRDLARHYAAIIVRGSHETPIFHGLAVSLVAEIAGVLQRAGFSEEDAGRRADVIYLSYLGLLMTFSNGAIDLADVTARLRDVIDLVASIAGAAK